MTLNYLFRLVLVSGLFFPAFIKAERIHLLFDPVCMDRLEFQQNRPEGKSVYVVYHVNIRPGEKLVLEVGEEGANQQNYLPTPNLSCANATFDETLMRRINSNVDEVYMVFPQADNKFSVSRVRLASLYLKSGSMVTYDSPKYRFRFDLNSGAIGENIALNNPGIKVYFEGRMENDCSGNYLFRQLSPQSAYPLIDLVLVPEIGIVEERSGANASAALNNMMSVVNINGKRGDRYLLEVCGQEPGTRPRGTAAAPATYATGTAAPYVPAPVGTPTGTQQQTQGLSPSGQPINQPSFGAPASYDVPTYVAPASTAPSTAAAPAAAAPKVHVVQRGETLYAIANKNGVSVDQVKAWNNLSSSSIRSGQELVVSKPADALAARSVSSYDQQGASFQWSQPAAATAVAATTAATPTPDANLPAWKTTNGIHVVQAGETVASIAMVYGYTEARFRSMNDLGPRDFIKVGQRMKTTDCAMVETTTTKGASSAAAPSSPSTTSTAGRIVPSGYSTSTPAPAGTAVQPALSSGSPQFSGGTSSYGSTPSYGSVPSYGSTPSYGAAPATTNANVSSGSPTFSSIIPQAYESNAASSAPASSGQRAIVPETEQRFGTPLSTGNYGNPYSNPTTNTNGYDPYASQPASSYSAPSNYDFDGGSPAASSTPPGSRRVHIVQDGETLYSIGQRYGLAVDRIRQLNNLGAGEVVMPYQRLFLD